MAAQRAEPRDATAALKRWLDSTYVPRPVATKGTDGFLMVPSLSAAIRAMVAR